MKITEDQLIEADFYATRRKIAASNPDTEAQAFARRMLGGLSADELEAADSYIAQRAEEQ